ncbi:MAG: hypothetical protein OEW48_14240 [Phycisphaerae bacterium]|nr:hypothetical protein [Phycisphaerae bacterium]
MGSCCFTPKKTQFLWWYWLLLFSIVGIPMFLAALYIERRSRTGGPEKKYTLRASSIFWGSTIISCVLCIFLIVFLTRVGDDFDPIFLNHWALVKLLVLFVFCMMFATGAAKAVKKRDRLGRRIAVLLGYFFGWALVIVGPKLLSLWGMRPFYFAVEMLPVILMEFAVCMLPAHYWNRFSDSPCKKSARMFLVSLLAGTFLFWLVAQCGDVVHKHFYQFFRGERPAKTSFVQDLSDAIH